MLKLLPFVSVFLLVASCTINSEPVTPNKIKVTGSSEMSVTPNEIYVSFTLSEYLDKKKQLVKLKDIKNEFMLICYSVGIIKKNIEITSYSGEKEWDNENWRTKKNSDMLASITYSVKMNNLKKLDKIVDKINGRSMQSFYIQKTTHSDIISLRRKIKEQAVKASKMKARYLVESIGQNLGGAILIEEVNSDSYSDGYYYPSRSTYLSNSNVSYSTTSSSDYSTPSVQKIKIRYEIKAEYLIE